MQTATVVENFDEEGKMNRLKVKFAWASEPSPWIRMTTSSSGSEEGKGLSIVPEKGEEVLVDFEGGNPEKPIIIGSLFNGKAISEIGDADNNIKRFKTRSGHTLSFDDTSGAEKITILDPNNNTIVIDTAEDTISITGNQAISLSAKEITINGEDSVKIESKSVSINGSDLVEVNSTTEVAVNSDSSLTLAGAQSAELSGMIVDVKGNTQANVNAVMVNLNS